MWLFQISGMDNNAGAQYGHWLCVRINDVYVESKESADSVYEKIDKLLKEPWRKHFQMYLFLVLIEPTALCLNASHTEITRNVAAS